MTTISTEALQDLQVSKLAQNFANIWVEKYPDLDLQTEVKFVHNRRFRADFGYVPNIVWVKKKPIATAPGILIECDGGVHAIKFKSDSEKEAIALQLGFTYFRLTEETLELKLDAIASAIRSLTEYAKVG